MKRILSSQLSDKNEFIVANLRQNYSAIKMILSTAAVFSVIMWAIKFTGLDHEPYFVNYYMAGHLILALASFFVLIVFQNPRQAYTTTYKRQLLCTAYLYVLLISVWSIVISCMDMHLGHHPVVYMVVSMAIPFYCALYPAFCCALSIISAVVIILFQYMVCLENDLSFTMWVIIYCVIACMINIKNYQVQHKNFIYQMRLQEEATHDALTSLKNLRALESELDVLKTHDVWINIVIIDVDDFKKINDTYGHQCGDTCLCALADNLKKRFPEGKIYRYGGDEFVLLTRFDGEEIEQRLGEINAMLPLAGDGINFHISGGYCAYDGKSSIKEIVSKADEALYKAKKNGKRCFVKFTDEPDIKPFSEASNA